MKKILTFSFIWAFVLCSTFAQKPTLDYYLTETNYDKNIPTPEALLGFKPGEWHITHDQLLMYMRALASASDRISIQEYARSYENRPLVYLTITSKKNHDNLESIRNQHIALCNPAQSSKADVSKMPLVLYQGFSIHGNEPSGGNAAPLVAYHLAASKSKEVERLLDNTIILLDPCYNPDGFNRFASWVNVHKSKNLVSDPQDREFSEAWPRGRTNHYWFDLNRDWLPTQHPESQGRIKTFHQWKPNILTDHHEMGSNNTFFFMPGIPSRTNPLTPQENQDLTGEIGTYHAAALDEIGSLYYSQESFDDYYYGKGSTYPDANGAIGILFEQGSSRGHLQETRHGVLSFPFTIRNQVRTALSTQKAAFEMREKLLNYQRRFYKTGMEEAKRDETKAYLFSESYDQERLASFIEILLRHEVKVHRLNQNTQIKGHTFKKENTYLVPLEQDQYRLAKAMFETRTTFQDSLFYDVSSWTLPFAFNLEYQALNRGEFSENLLGEQIRKNTSLRVQNQITQSNYGYFLNWDNYLAPNALYDLLKNGLRAQVASEPLTTKEGKVYSEGTIFIPIQNQNQSADQIFQLMQNLVQKTGVRIEGVTTGSTPTGLDLGSPSFNSLKLPKVALLVGSGVSSYDAGEVWHLLDQRYDMPLTKLETTKVASSDLSKYTVIVLVDGSQSGISNSGSDKLKEWVRHGGTLITCRGAVRWAKSKGLAGVEFKNNPRDLGEKPRRSYATISEDAGANVIGGAIFDARLDLTHPLAYGYHREQLPIFRRGTMVMQPTKNPYATPLIYTDNPLLSGYVSSKNEALIRNSASIIVSGTGSGKVICMADNPNFRAFWYGTNKLFANAIFFGHTISRSAVERVVRSAPNGR